MDQDILTLARESAAKRVLFTPHALSQMSHAQRLIVPDEVIHVVRTGIVIEDYPDDVRGHSCLILGFGQQNRPIHVVCAPKPDFLAIITTYLPDQRQWSADFRKRL